MRGLECEEALVKIALNSGRIQGVEPLSLLLVGDPGWGKTTLLELFKDVKSVFYWADVDQGGMRKAIHHVQMNGGMRHKTHIIIPDLTRVFSRKHSTVMNSLSYLTMLCEDGVCDTAVYGLDVDAKLGYQHVKNTARLGIISAITTECLDDIKSEFPRLKDTLLSRFIIKDISTHSPEMISLIADDVRLRKPSKLKQPLYLLPRNTQIVGGTPLFSYQNERNMRDFRLKIDLISTIYALFAPKSGGYHRTLTSEIKQNQPSFVENEEVLRREGVKANLHPIHSIKKYGGAGIESEVSGTILELFADVGEEEIRLGTTTFKIKKLLEQFGSDENGKIG